MVMIFLAMSYPFTMAKLHCLRLGTPPLSLLVTHIHKQLAVFGILTACHGVFKQLHLATLHQLLLIRSCLLHGNANIVSLCFFDRPWNVSDRT